MSALAQVQTWSLLDPWFLGLVPLVWLGWAWRLRRPRAAVASASVSFFDGLPRSLRARLVWLPSALQALALTALAVALARPVTREVLPLREEGVDILLVLDISSSMGTPDMDDDKPVRRIEAARDKALEFARGRPTDRVGLMTYAMFPELRCPLTLDKQALAAFLRSIDTVPERSEENATAVGVALGQAVRFLETSAATSKVVVLLTDGQNNIAEVMPLDAAKLAADAGVRVHTIGLGKGTPDPFFRRMIPVDFSELEEVAKIGGGEFFAATDADKLAEVYAAIDELEKVEVEDPRYRTSDGFAWPLLFGVGLLGLALLLECAWIRGAP